MIPEDQLAIILSVVDRVKKKPFSFMSEEDVRQEAHIIALSVLKDWDGVRSLENFLMYSVSRRLISLSRNYYKNKAKKDVLDFVELLVQPTVEYDTVTPDLVEYVLNNLPVNVRSDYLRWANGVSLPSSRKEAVVKKVREIVDGQS